jgi:hypothetical protein
MRSILKSTQGAFSLFVGGKSVGKSFLIQKMCRDDLNGQGGCLVAVIDGRPSIHVGGYNSGVVSFAYLSSFIENFCDVSLAVV